LKGAASASLFLRARAARSKRLFGYAGHSLFRLLLLLLLLEVLLVLLVLLLLLLRAALLEIPCSTLHPL
jgi:hypothetical protein